MSAEIEIEIEIPVVGGVTYEPMQFRGNSGRASGTVSVTVRAAGVFEKVVAYAEKTQQRCEDRLLDDLFHLTYSAGYDEATREAQEKVSGAAAFVEARMGVLAERTRERDEMLVDMAQHAKDNLVLRSRIIELERESGALRGELQLANREHTTLSSENTALREQIQKLQEQFEERGEALRIATEAQVAAEDDPRTLIDRLLPEVDHILLTCKPVGGADTRYVWVSKEDGEFPDSLYMARELLDQRLSTAQWVCAGLYVPMIQYTQEISKRTVTKLTEL